MAETNSNPPPGYSTSLPAVLEIPPERMEELVGWLTKSVIPTCTTTVDVLDMINAGRGIENLTVIEKLLLAYVVGHTFARGPPGGVFIFGGML